MPLLAKRPFYFTSNCRRSTTLKVCSVAQMQYELSRQFRCASIPAGLGRIVVGALLSAFS